MTNEVKCPKCGSSSITANKKGFGVGKAIAGDLIAGPIGLLAGGMGSNKVIITCLACGHRFKPGDYQKQQQMLYIASNSEETERRILNGRQAAENATVICVIIVVIIVFLLWL